VAQKSPCIPTKEAYISTKEPCVILPSTSCKSQVFQQSVKAPFLLEKKLYIPAKEPKTPANQPCISALHSCKIYFFVLGKSCVLSAIHFLKEVRKSHLGCMCPMFPQKNPILAQKSTVFLQKSPVLFCHSLREKGWQI